MVICVVVWISPLFKICFFSHQSIPGLSASADRSTLTTPGWGNSGATGILSLGDGVCSRGETDTILGSNKAALFNIHDGCEKQARWIHQTPEERLGRFIPNRGRDGHMQYIPR